MNNPVTFMNGLGINRYLTVNSTWHPLFLTDILVPITVWFLLKFYLLGNLIYLRIDLLLLLDKS
jgi:hypothetical protein